MKVFVIKIKDGCYWLGGFYGKNNYDDIAHAKVYHLQSQAEKQCKLVNETYGYNAKVVPITIAEGDFEQQLAEKEVKIEVLERDVENLHKTLQEANEQLAEKDNDHDMLIDDFQQERERLCSQIKTESDARERFVEKVKQLKEQLTEKEKQIRKQVCDEIRIALTSVEPNCSMEDMNSNLYEFTGRDIYAILEQIEEAVCKRDKVLEHNKGERNER